MFLVIQNFSNHQHEDGEIKRKREAAIHSFPFVDYCYHGYMGFQVRYDMLSTNVLLKGHNCNEKFYISRTIWTLFKI